MNKSIRDNRILNSVFLFQGCYFVITGVWPVVNIASFMMATGPKQETWLVQMVGLLSLSIGLTFLRSALRRQGLPIFLGYLVSLSFLTMDIVFVANGTIRPVYLIDAAIQLLFLTLLSVLLLIKRRQTNK